MVRYKNLKSVDPGPSSSKIFSSGPVGLIFLTCRVLVPFGPRFQNFHIPSPVRTVPLFVLSDQQKTRNQQGWPNKKADFPARKWPTSKSEKTLQQTNIFEKSRGSVFSYDQSQKPKKIC